MEMMEQKVLEFGGSTGNGIPVPNKRQSGINHLWCENLAKSFRQKKVVDDVSIEIWGGEVVGLLGPNGAGKTTIFYMIVGLLQPNGGKMYLNNEEITSLPMYLRARKGVGYLPQEPSVFRKLTVEENLMAILETLPLPKEEKKNRLESLLDELGLSSLRKQKAYVLSGGERRRVEITRALVLSPSFILLDEPFSGIDPIAVLDIQGIIRQLKSKGIGIIITDHNVRETLGVCDRAYILNEGQILEEGAPEKIARSQRAKKIYLGDGFTLGTKRRTRRRRNFVEKGIHGETELSEEHGPRD